MKAPPFFVRSGREAFGGCLRAGHDDRCRVCLCRCAYLTECVSCDARFGLEAAYADRGRNRGWYPVLVVAHVGCTGGLDGMRPVRCFPVSGSRFCLRDSSVNGAIPKGFGAIIGGQRIVRQSFFFLSLSTLYLRIVCRGQRIIQEAGFISLRSSSYCCCAFRSFRVSGWETWW